jgi:hypothetical protein
MWADVDVVCGLFPMNHIYCSQANIVEGNVPQRLRLVSYRTLTDSFGGLKGRGGMRRIGHARKVSIKGENDVQNRQCLASYNSCVA